MTTITLPRATVEQALEALTNCTSEYGHRCNRCDSEVDEGGKVVAALRAALAQKHDPVAHSGWVLREVLFDNGEPIGHREPQHSPAALGQQAEAETCTWQQDGDSESGLYATSCRRYFSLDDGTPEDNRLAWCCYCGKRLVQELITEDEDE